MKRIPVYPYRYLVHSEPPLRLHCVRTTHLYEAVSSSGARAVWARPVNFFSNFRRILQSPYSGIVSFGRSLFFAARTLRLANPVIVNPDRNIITVHS